MRQLSDTRTKLCAQLFSSKISVSPKDDSTFTRTQTSQSENKRPAPWLSINFKELARLPKDRAAALLKQNFPSASLASLEATLEYVIAQAGRLVKHDLGAQQMSEQLQQLKQQQQGAQQQQQTQLKQLLERLKAQKESLLSEIAKKEAELAATVNPILKELMKLVINA